MDILYTGRVDGFCIVSSDSDFTRLATRLREAGMKVFGLGERKTPPAFISACDKFIYIEILKSADDGSRRKENPRKTRSSQKKKKEGIAEPAENTETVQRVSQDVVKLIISSVNDLADENGWAFLGEVGNLILKKKPDFDPRNYGYKKLVLLMEGLDEFEINKENSAKGNTTQVYVRVKGQ
jgi:uncharacterized LabA/DUF88 family protein